MADYDIFLSHSSKDNDEAIRLCKDLESLQYRVWLDKKDIRAANIWVEEIEKAIDTSCTLVVIWNKNSAASTWVKDELARAKRKNIPVIPLRYDDTEETITIERVQYIDFRNGFFEPFGHLISTLRPFVDEAGVERSISTNLAWNPEKRPFIRSQYLSENNYLNQKASNFAENEATKTLKRFEGQPKPERFVTLISIPVPQIIDVEKEQSIQIWRDYCSKKYDASVPKWQRLDNRYLNQPRKTQHSVIFYDNPRETSNFDTWAFAKFDTDGVIEFGDGVNLAFDYEDSRNGEKRQGFNLLPIIGTAWKFLYFSAHYYQSVSYEGRFQFLLNLKNTKNTKLDGFADHWRSSYDRVMHAYNQGVAGDENLQFIYDIDVKMTLENPPHLENIIMHLGRQIQSAFNLDTKLRFIHTETNEFDWGNFPRDFL